MEINLIHITEQYISDYFNFIGLLQDELSLEILEILELDDVYKTIPHFLTELSKETLVKLIDVFLENDDNFNHGDLLNLIEFSATNSHINEHLGNTKCYFKLPN